ncbi:hypothetical protein RvY_00211-2 [Ramazzottius varieornatus]|uniref:Major facilitator superfamily (MFS) profile domain-containing protein n=1 Tax=Ramazzottius varieornatus TaxID=947166 RepID=A0A1D1UIA2_RAMVA|nr:hypothetical protein RvY_00211-2 [Ramazzottius varieornatus]
MKMFDKAKKKIREEATWTLFWTSVIVGIGSGFYQGFNAAVINAPQTTMGLWIRNIECAKHNQSKSPTVNDTERWCKVLSEKEQEKMFKENPTLNVIWTGIASIYTLGSVIGALSIIPICQRFGRFIEAILGPSTVYNIEPDLLNFQKGSVTLQRYTLYHFLPSSRPVLRRTFLLDVSCWAIDQWFRCRSLCFHRHDLFDRNRTA